MDERMSNEGSSLLAPVTWLEEQIQMPAQLSQTPHPGLKPGATGAVSCPDRGVRCQTSGHRGG